MSEQDKTPAEELTNTNKPAEELSNTEISKEQFNAYIEANNLKVFTTEDFQTLNSNLLKEGSKKGYNSAYSKGLDKAKIELAKKYGLEIQEDSKFEDVLNSIDPKKSKPDNQKDLEILQNKLLDTENMYKQQIAEMESKYLMKDVESKYNEAWSSIENQIEGTQENKARFKQLYFTMIQQSHDFTGEVVKRGDYEYKDALRNPLSKVDAIKAFLLDNAPLKPQKPVKGGTGMDSDLSSSNAWINSINSTNELYNTMQQKGIDINSPQATKLHADWYSAKLKK